MTCLGDFRIEEIRDNNNEIGLKEGGGIEMSTTVLHSRAALTFVFNILFGIVKMHRWKVFHVVLFATDVTSKAIAIQR